MTGINSNDTWLEEAGYESELGVWKKCKGEGEWQVMKRITMIPSFFGRGHGNLTMVSHAYSRTLSQFNLLDPLRTANDEARTTTHIVARLSRGLNSGVDHIQDCHATRRQNTSLKAALNFRIGGSTAPSRARVLRA